ncbi:uncharacterized protein LOC131890667 [Tigriopus californicus]|uniref:uncharacterized protein LOC131890667 n=1 Tax=Tigriopus californicus TaxID=6832 RepID=UPI0027DA9C5A|nr:uncharacterized protein LOC131890667 [Tigriopus californicus]
MYCTTYCRSIPAQEYLNVRPSFWQRLKFFHPSQVGVLRENKTIVKREHPLRHTDIADKTTIEACPTDLDGVVSFGSSCAHLRQSGIRGLLRSEVSEPTGTSSPIQDKMKTPKSENEFTPDWAMFVLESFFNEEEMKLTDIEIVQVQAQKNEVQGILSETFVVDVDFRHQGNEESKSIFVKVPLHGEPLYKVVNEREKIMFQDVLPKLQGFLDDHCQGFFRLPMPQLIHCQYDGRGEEDVFVMNNLLSEGYYNFNTSQCLDEDHMKAVLDGLSYLHGTGLAFKQSCGGLKATQSKLPGLEVQIQMYDLIGSSKMRDHFRKLFRPYLHFMEEAEPGLAKQTAYMKRMHKHILKVIENLENCGFDRLITLAHGDAKPNNFMFRKIEIDIEDLECEGIESILIDWQGGFLGSVANDLMWALFPYVERDKTLYLKAMEYYFDQLRNVLDSFGYSYQDLDLPDNFQDFSSLLKKCLVLEFLIVTVIKPIMSLENPDKLHKWHKETLKNTRRRFKKGVVKPNESEVFSSSRFPGFCRLYFNIATALGAFQEMGQIYFNEMKDSMFDQDKLDNHDSDDEDDQDLFSRVINAPQRTLIRATAVFTLVTSVILGIFFAWKNRLHTILY